MARWITFDCYGTLVDWLGGMRAGLRAVVGADADRLVAAYYQLELPVQGLSESHLLYRDVLTETLRRAAEQERVALAAQDEGVLVRTWDRIEPFADTPAALQELKADGWSIGVLTNCDDDLFALTAAKLGVDLDAVVTAEQVESYKPRLGHFLEFARRTGADRGNWVHAGNSWMHDVVPARRLGLSAVWIDRDRSGHDGSLASRHLHSMAELPDALRHLSLPALDD